jgi:hypothetical protein
MDIQFYLRPKENNISNLKTADMNNMSPRFVCVNNKIDRFNIEINNGLEVEKVEKRNLYDLFETKKIEALDIETNKLLAKISFEEPLKNTVNFIFDLKLFYSEGFNATVYRFDINYDIKLKKVKPKKVIEKLAINQLKRNVNKNYIKQLVLELVQEESLKLSNVKFFGFFKSVPIGKEVFYSWNKGNLVCKIEKSVDLYLDSIAFIDVSTDEKYLKFIRR